ncbi:hypothetical protein QOZ80_5AG0361400 [Eleusine coracana subsp. coracana]|nr:hypothetical protein QOZ80_5AG0361400 [Eleusine coracana subsp. coracana]
MSESDEERPSCSCRQSKCVQRYCSCFRAFYYCSDNCQCIGCRNTERREAYVEERVQMILKKNPNAFDPKVAIVQEVAQSPAVEEANQVFVQSYSAAAVLSDKELSDVKGCSCQAIKCSDTYSSLQSMILPHHEEECHFLPIFRCKDNKW